MAELAAEVSAQSRKEITYTSLPAEEYTKILIQAGLPEPFAAIVADSDLAAERGDLTTTSTDLRDLIGRPTTSLADAVTQALKN
jgi:NAD(P)H dehydrogenase (quinone)